MQPYSSLALDITRIYLARSKYNKIFLEKKNFHNFLINKMYVKYIWLDLKYIALDLYSRGKLLNLAYFSSLKLLFLCSFKSEIAY